VGSCYLFRLGRQEIVDATVRGGMARFINHSCEPNAYAKKVSLEGGTKKIVFFALRALYPGEEVFYDYKFPIEDDKIPCYCGAPLCRRFLN
jgi:SET domain-containing protein